jgi:hypothetical protein
MVTGQAFLGETPTSGPLRVWYYGEDPGDELDRRIAAICQHFGIQKDDLGDRLFRDSIHNLQLKRFATQGKSGGKSGSVITFDKTIEEDIRYTIRQAQLDVVIFDPLISLHSAIENDNVAMDQIVRKLGAIAAETDSAIDLVHHARKPTGSQTELTVDDGRGARSLIDAARSARILNRMSVKEAEDAGILPKDRLRYFRADRGKANMAPPEAATWSQIVSVILPNTDNVGVVTPWTYPNPLDGVAATDVDWIRNLVRANPDLGCHPNSKAWIGIELAKHLALNPSSKAHHAKLKKILKTWFDNGVLAVDEREDPETRKKRKFVKLGDWNHTYENDATTRSFRSAQVGAEKRERSWAAPTCDNCADYYSSRRVVVGANQGEKRRLEIMAVSGLQVGATLAQTHVQNRAVKSHCTDLLSNSQARCRRASIRAN